MQPTARTIMETPNEISRSEDLKRRMREALEQTIEIRVERYLEVAHQGVIPNHHFAAAVVGVHHFISRRVSA